MVEMVGPSEISLHRPPMLARPSSLSLISRTAVLCRPSMLPLRALSSSSHVMAAHGSAVDTPRPTGTLLDALKEKVPGKEAAVSKRLDQLKNMHSKGHGFNRR